jgi:hypothetical protein
VVTRKEISDLILNSDSKMGPPGFEPGTKGL